MKKTKMLVVIALALVAVLCFALTACTENATLASVSVTGTPTYGFAAGDTLTLDKLAGVKVAVNYSDGSKVEYDLSRLTALPDGMTIDKINTALAEGANDVTVAMIVGEITKTAKFTINIAASPVLLEGITLSQEGVVLTEEDVLDLAHLAGVKMTATYSNGTTENFVFANLTALPEGLTVDKLGATLEAGETAVKFTYVKGDVTKEATITLTVAELTVPEGTLVVETLPEAAMSATSTASGATATANANFAYGEEGLVATVYVTDSAVYVGDSVYLSDGVMFYLDKVIRQRGYTDNTVTVTVDASGRIGVRNLSKSEVVADSGVTATAQNFSTDGKHIAGYCLTINVPYALFGVTADEAQLAACLALINANDDEDANVAIAGSYGEQYANVHTYAMIAKDGTVSANTYVQYGVVWGNAGSLMMKNGWNIDGDDGSETAEIHNESNQEDNNVYMHRSGAAEYYAEAKFNLKQLLNGERWGKFGLSVISADGQRGFFYYVDATSANGETVDGGAVALGTAMYNGGWSGWSNIGSLGGNSSQYQGDNYVTLAIYRDGSVFSLYANGNFIAYAACDINDEEIAYVGVVCFNMLISVKGYSYSTDEQVLAKYRTETVDVDYLFLGDSYIDTAFWYNWANEFGDKSAANIGVGGTKVPYWQGRLNSVKKGYDAKQIVIHIGVNDIDDSGMTGAATWENLRAMLEAYNAAYPEAKIHYITVEHNMMFTAKWAEYDALNELVKAYAADKEWLNIIDMAALITAKGNSTQHWFGADGLHYGVDGYALLNREVCSALGIERPATIGETGLGDLNVEGAPQFAYSAGWVLEDGVAHNVGTSYERIGSETQLMISGLYDSDFYAEVKLSLGDCYCPSDAWAKTGLALRGEGGTYMYFINSSSVINPQRTADGHVKYTDNYGNVFYRPDVRDRNWQSELFGYFYLGDQDTQTWSSFDHYTDNSYATLAVAKLGSKLIFIANGFVVGTLNASEYAADEKVAVAVFSFNMDVYAKDAQYITGADEVAYKLATAHKVNVIQPTGATISVDKETAKMTDVVTITITPEEGYVLDKVLVDGEAITANEQGVYTFTMPDAEVTVTATFIGRKSVDMSAVSGKLEVSNSSPMEGDEITFTPSANWKIEKLYANETELAANADGTYKLTVTEDVVMTAVAYFTESGMLLDGTHDGEKYGQAIHFWVEGNRDVTVYAVKTEGGVWMYLVAHTNDNVASADNWYDNNDWEFAFADGAHGYIANNGATSGVTQYYKNTTLLDSGDFAGKYEHVYEAYVAKADVNGWVEDGNVQYNYAYKAPAEAARFEGQSHVQFERDAWWQTTIGGLGTRAMSVFAEGESHPANLFVTSQGLTTTVPEAKNAKIDGNLEEYAQKSSVTVGNENAKFIFTGFGADDGFYFAATVYQKQLAASTAEWWLNDNIEIKMGTRQIWCGIAFFDNFVDTTRLTRQAMVRTALTEGEMHAAGYRYETKVEIFYPGAAQESVLQFGCAGNGFNGWQALIWDDNVVTYNADGIHTMAEKISTNGIVLDGKLDDAAWTNEILGKSFTTTANGAQITIVGFANGKGGVMLGVTVDHNVANGTKCLGDGTAWWHYMGPELRLGLGGMQLAATTWNNATRFATYCGYSITDNGDGATYKYTTVFEMYMPAGYYGDVALVMAGVYESSWTLLYGSNNWSVTHYVTTSGIRAA